MGEKPVFDLVKKNDFEKIVACRVLKLMRRYIMLVYEILGLRNVLAILLLYNNKSIFLMIASFGIQKL